MVRSGQVSPYPTVDGVLYKIYLKNCTQKKTGMLAVNYQKKQTLDKEGKTDISVTLLGRSGFTLLLPKCWERVWRSKRSTAKAASADSAPLVKCAAALSPTGMSTYPGGLDEAASSWVDSVWPPASLGQLGGSGAELGKERPQLAGSQPAWAPRGRRRTFQSAATSPAKQEYRQHHCSQCSNPSRCFQPPPQGAARAGRRRRHPPPA